VRVKEIPRQISSSEEAERVETIRSAATASVATVSSLQMLLTIVLQTSLSKLMGLINSQQI